MKKLTILAGMSLIFSMAAFPAYAISVLRLGNPPDSGGFLFGSEVRAISNTSLGIKENGNSQPTLVNPLLLILGVANDTGSFVAPAITLSTGSGSIGGPVSFGGSWNTTTGYAGAFTSGSVYDFIGLSPTGNNSNSFGNWAAADLAVNGINATDFGIYVYELSGTGIKGGNTINVTFGSPLANGTFAVAYGQGSDKAFDTPFTESGLTTAPVTEPGTMMLLGVGFFGLAICGKRLKNA